MLTCFVDNKGIIHYEFLPPKETGKQACYFQDFEHDNAPSYGAYLVSQYWPQKC
jgi:hypothetical protein